MKTFNVIVIFKSVNKTEDSLIKLPKTRFLKFEKTNLIYKINCKNCNSRYIGQTFRYLKNRIYEHK